MSSRPPHAKPVAGHPVGPGWMIVSVCLLTLAAGTDLCFAQRSRSYRPTEVGPTQRLEQNFGRVGGWLGAGQTRGFSTGSRSPAGSTASLSNPLRQRRDPRFYRRPGMGQADMDLGYGIGAQAGRPLLYGRPGANRLSLSNNRLASPRPVPGALSQVYQQTFRSQAQVVNRFSGRTSFTTSSYLGWVPRETGATAGWSNSDEEAFSLLEPVVAITPDDQLVLDEPRQSLAELVSTHVVSLRRTYVQEGWERFAAGDYQGALRVFSLAANASLDDPEELAVVKLSLAYTAIAAGQHAQAANHVEWLITGGSTPQSRSHPEAFNRIFTDNGISTIGEMYSGAGGVAGAAEHQRHNRLVESAAAQQPDSARLRALVAVAEWGRGRRANAIFEAKRITDPSMPLSGLAAVLESAERLRDKSPGLPGGTQATAPPAPTVFADPQPNQ